LYGKTQTIKLYVKSGAEMGLRWVKPAIRMGFGGLRMGVNGNYGEFLWHACIIGMELTSLVFQDFKEKHLSLHLCF